MSETDQPALDRLTEALEARWHGRIKARTDLGERDREIVERFTGFVRDAAKTGSHLTREVFTVKFETARQDLSTSRTIKVAVMQSDTNKERQFGTLTLRLDVTKSHLRLNGQSFDRQAASAEFIRRVGDLIETFCGPDGPTGQMVAEAD